MARRNDSHKTKIILFVLVLALILLGAYRLFQAGKHQFEKFNDMMSTRIDRALGKSTE